MGLRGSTHCWLYSAQNASAGVERLLLGNKCDMDGKRKVQRDHAEKVGPGRGVRWGSARAPGLGPTLWVGRVSAAWGSGLLDSVTFLPAAPAVLGPGGGRGWGALLQWVPLSRQLAKEHGIRFFETSAKSSLNVEEVSEAGQGSALWALHMAQGRGP